MASWTRPGKSPVKSHPSDLNMLQAFQLLDTDNKGRVSPEGIESVLCHDSGNDPKEVARLMAEVGQDGRVGIYFPYF